MASTTIDPASAPASTTSAADGISYGTLYKTVGDVPEEGISYILPKDDYRHACYMWETPNYGVVIPGEPSYKMPVNRAMLAAFGFLDTDTLNDVLIVSDCSDWKSYVKGRASGQWLEMQKKILQQAVPIAPAPSPSATSPAWDWSKVTTLSLRFYFTPLSDAFTAEEINTDMEEEIKTDEAHIKFFAALFPSLDLTGVAIRPELTFLSLSSPAGIQSAVKAFFSGADAETIKGECVQANKHSGWSLIDGALPMTVVPASAIGSVTLGDITLDASTVRIEVAIADCVSTN